MQAHSEFPFLWFSAEVSWVQCTRSSIPCTFSTSQIWCSDIQAASAYPFPEPSVDPFPDRLDTPIPGHHEWLVAAPLQFCADRRFAGAPETPSIR
jgi:hypothetical protein